MRILFIGDIVGRTGRAVVTDRLPGLVRDWKLDLVVINGENAAGGFGITESNDLSTFIDLMVRFGEEFDSLESISWETQALRDEGVPNDSRVELLLERLGLAPGFGEQEGTHVS